MGGRDGSPGARRHCAPRGRPLPEKAPAPEPLDPALRDRIYAFALRLTGDRSLADDVAQETLFRVLRAGAPMAPAYLFRTALNLVRTERRARARRPAVERVFMDRIADRRTPGPLETLQRREAGERFWRTVGLLPGREREALVMRVGEGLPCSRIAEALGISTNAVSCLLRRGRDRLAATLAPGSEP